MANEKFTSREEEALFRLVVVLNGSLQFIIARLEELTRAKVLSAEYLAEMKRLTDKIETEIGPK